MINTYRVPLTLLFLFPKAFAQTATVPQLDESVVVGSDVLNTLDAETLFARRGLGGDFQEILPSLAGAYGGNPTTGVFSLRGLNQDGFGGGVGAVTNPLISVFENGVPLSTTTLRYLPTPVIGLDSFRLRRGPVNDAAGPAALAGALFFENSSVLSRPEGKIVMEYSEDATLSTYFTQNIPLIADELSLRLSYYHFESDGHASAPSVGRDFSAYDRDRIEGAFLWHPGKNKDQSLRLNLLYDQSGGNPQANTAIIPGALSLYDRVSTANRASSYPAERWSASLRGDFLLPGEIKLSTVTAFQKIGLGQNLDFDGAPLLDWTINGDIDERLFSQSVIFSGEKGPWDWQAGAYFDDNSYDVAFSGVGIAPLPTGSPYDNRGRTDARTYALHGNVGRKLSDQFRTSAGLRIQRDERGFSGLSSFGPFPTTPSSGDADDDVFLPSVMLEYFPDDASVVSLSFARGHRAGGVAFAPLAGVAGEYGAESSWDLELKARHEISQELTLSAAVFYSQLEDQQVANAVPGGLPGVDLLIANAGESQRFGAEIEAAWEPMDGLSFYGNAAWLKTEFDELTLNGVDRSGQEFPNAPEWSMAVGAEYHHDSGMFGNVNYSWSDSSYAITASPQESFLETRSLLNARIGWAGENTKVYLFASNLLDDEFALYRGTAIPPVIPQVGKAGAPRMFGVGVEYSW